MVSPQVGADAMARAAALLGPDVQASLATTAAGETRQEVARLTGLRPADTRDLRKSAILLAFEVCWAPDRAPLCRRGSRSSSSTEG